MYVSNGNVVRITRVKYVATFHEYKQIYITGVFQQTKNICTTPAQRLRRWSSIVQLLYRCFEFAGLAAVIISVVEHSWEPHYKNPYVNGTHFEMYIEALATRVLFVPLMQIAKTTICQVGVEIWFLRNA